MTSAEVTVDTIISTEAKLAGDTEETKKLEKNTVELNESEEDTVEMNKPEKDSVEINKLESEKDKSFKKPLLLFGPRKGKPIVKKVEQPQILKPKVPTLVPALQLYGDPATNQAKEIPPLPYTEPPWGGINTDNDFALEVLKNGVIIERVQLDSKSFFVFGRLSNCDIQMNHPSSSRYHAILQYRPISGTSENESKGFYIYDLGSTHGTFLNKKQLKPKVFAPVKVGHVLTIGGSSRLFILQGPAELSEPESELTVTELKEQRRQKEIRDRLDAERAERERLEAEERRKQKEEEAGVDWGMGEDADEETDLTENPYATTTNEELYLNDPKKSLRGWFEREGYELHYDVTERSPGQFLCRITLPVDGPQGRSLIAEALVKGKKKEAVVQGAMEACRLLDRHGLFRQATHEGRGQRKKRDWAEDDYYDSDEDNFLDRTGTIEAKRQRRMAVAGKLESKPDTYQSLVAKLEALREELIKTETECQALSEQRTVPKPSADEEDELDAFMSSLQSGTSSKDKVAQRIAKAKMEKLKQEEARLIKLANIARPAMLPPLVQTSSSTKQTKKLGALIGTRPHLSKPKPPLIKDKSCSSSTQVTGNMEEYESEEEEEETGKQALKIADPEENMETDFKTDEPSSSNAQNRQIEKKRILGPSIPSAMLKKLKEDVEDKDSKPQRTRIRQRNKNTPVFHVHEEDELSEWVPPVGQTGDGRTKLNDKLGY